MKNNSVKPKDTVQWYLRASLKYKSLMLCIYGLMPVAQILEEVISPILVAGVMNKIVRGDFEHLTTKYIGPILLIIVALEITSHFLWIFIIRKFWKWQESVMRDLQMTTFDHLTTMSYGFFSNRFSGSLVSQVNKFVGSFERLTDALTWNVYKLIIGLIATCVVLLPKAPLVVAGILALSIVYVPLVYFYRRKQIPFNKRWASAETKRTGQLADSIGNILAVKSFAHEKLESRLFKDKVNDVFGRSMQTRDINMNQELVTGLVQRSINVMVIAVSVWLATSRRVEVGVIYLSLEYTRALMRRLWDLNNTFRNVTRVFGDANDMTNILTIPPEIADPTEPETSRINSGSVTFKDVTFSYPEAGKNLFENFNLDIKPGEKVGLVGHSGSGKTTITKLILRFMDVNDGQILIDSQDISAITQNSLRSSISYVAQEPVLFHRTIAENIAYGKLNATEEEIKKAAELAHAHEFIKDLPKGYDTLVGERGVKLSGGQKQRVAIARSLLKSSPILLLDEATSALDSESESLIQDALWKLMQDKTAIVIAHRLSTIQKMDRIVVLQNGKIVEQGSHKDLLSKGGIYADLWAHQSGGFLAED